MPYISQNIDKTIHIYVKMLRKNTTNNYIQLPKIYNAKFIFIALRRKKYHQTITGTNKNKTTIFFVLNFFTKEVNNHNIPIWIKRKNTDKSES